MVVIQLTSEMEQKLCTECSDEIGADQMQIDNFDNWFNTKYGGIVKWTKDLSRLKVEFKDSSQVTVFMLRFS